MHLKMFENTPFTANQINRKIYKQITKNYNWRFVLISENELYWIDWNSCYTNGSHLWTFQSCCICAGYCLEDSQPMKSLKIPKQSKTWTIQPMKSLKIPNQSKTWTIKSMNISNQPKSRRIQPIKDLNNLTYQKRYRFQPIKYLKISNITFNIFCVDFSKFNWLEGIHRRYLFFVQKIFQSSINQILLQKLYIPSIFYLIFFFSFLFLVLSLFYFLNNLNDFFSGNFTRHDQTGLNNFQICFFSSNISLIYFVLIWK